MSSTNTIDLSGFSKQYAARDLPSNLKLKYRETGQAAPDELRKDKKDLRRDLDEREKIASSKESSNSGKRLSLLDVDKPSSKKHRIEHAPANPDADEVLPDDDDSDSDSDSDSDDDTVLKRSIKRAVDDEDENDDGDEDEDDDDTEALMAELNKIKQERAAEAAKQEAERKVREEKIRVENILKGNPLLNPDASGGAAKGAASSDFRVKRRWDDDVVFKNCAKVEDNKKKDFINDTLRSEFHKKFMERYVK